LKNEAKARHYHPMPSEDAFLHPAQLGA
jgi:hypothetical protein